MEKLTWKRRNEKNISREQSARYQTAFEEDKRGEETPLLEFIPERTNFIGQKENLQPLRLVFMTMKVEHTVLKVIAISQLILTTRHI